MRDELRQESQKQQQGLRVQAADAGPPRRPAHLFGDPDYLLRVVTRDLPAYRQLYDERLATLPGVLRLNSTLVMKSVVEARPLPL